jgi:hypothetical protein
LGTSDPIELTFFVGFRRLREASDIELFDNQSLVPSRHTSTEDSVSVSTSGDRLTAGIRFPGPQVLVLHTPAFNFRESFRVTAKAVSSPPDLMSSKFAGTSPSVKMLQSFPMFIG